MVGNSRRKEIEMKALIIEEKDIKVLRDRLKLERFKLQGDQLPVDEIFRHFNYIIESWLTEQGL